MDIEIKKAVEYAVSTNSLEKQNLTEEEKKLVIESIKEKESTKEFLKNVKEMIKEKKGEEKNGKNRK